MPEFKFGDRQRRDGRLYEYIPPGWWQPVLTDQERETMIEVRAGRADAPVSWEPTQEELETAERFADAVMGRKQTA